MADTRITQLRMLQNSFFLETQLKDAVLKFTKKLGNYIGFDPNIQ